MFPEIPHLHQKKKDNKSFYNSLLLSFFAAAIISTLVLSVFLTGNYLDSAVKSARSYNQQLLSQTNYAIDQMNENVDNVAMSLLGNSGVSAYLSLTDENSTAPVLASQAVDSQLMVLPYIESIYLYNKNLNLLYSSRTGGQLSPEEFEDQEIVRCLKTPSLYGNKSGRPIPSHKDEKTGAFQTFTYYYPDKFSKNQEYPSTIVINVYASTLTDSIRTMESRPSGSHTSFVLLDEKGNYLTSVLDETFPLNNEEIFEKSQNMFPDIENMEAFPSIKGVQYFQTHTNTNENNWYLVNFIPAGLVFQNALSAAFWGCIILILALLFAFFICRYFARKLNTPLESITKQLKSRGITPESFSSAPKEFQLIVSSLASLQENNQALRTLQNKSRYSLTQAFLYNLVTNRHTDAPSILRKNLEELGLSHLRERKLCMAVIKIDRYQEFLKERNPEELWAVRFAVVNIAEELSGAMTDSNAFSCDNDKFVLLMSFDQERDLSALEEELNALSLSVQENISRYLHFTVTITYSTLFQGLSNLPAVYRNLEHALTLKMRLGHEAIISPYSTEETEEEPFQFSGKILYPLTDRLSEGNFQESFSLYEKASENLFFCDYDEIQSALTYLVYSIYERLAEKYPMLKGTLTTAQKKLLLELEGAETGDEVQTHMRQFFHTICSSVAALKQNPANQNAAVTAQKIARIIEEEYTNPALCLCSAADKVGLSSNYTGQIFKQYMQKSVAQYILDLRMEKLAYYLQNTDLPLTEILDKIGMEKNNYFYTRFKKYFGMSLGEYRQQFQNTPGGEN